MKLHEVLLRASAGEDQVVAPISSMRIGVTSEYYRRTVSGSKLFDQLQSSKLFEAIKASYTQSIETRLSCLAASLQLLNWMCLNACLIRTVPNSPDPRGRQNDAQSGRLVQPFPWF